MIPCSPKNNFTLRWALLDFNYGNLYFRNDKGQPDGIYLKFLLRKFFLTSFENVMKYCKIILVDLPGIYHKENNSYSGGFGLVQQSKADSFLRSTDYRLKDKFYFTNCVTGTQMFALQIIHKKTNEDDNGLSYLLNFLIPSLEFSLLLVASFIFYFGFLFFALRTKMVSKFVLKCLSFLFVIFMFYIDNFINGNLNTSNVIVDTSDLLVNLDKVLNTKKELCFNMLNQPENDYFKEARKGTIASKLYDKINKIDPCHVFNGGKPGNFLSKNLNKTFLLVFDLGLNRLTKAIRTAVKKDVFTSTRPIYGNLNAFVMSKTITKYLRKIINTYVNNLFEYGYIIEIFRNIPNYSGFEEIKDSDYRHYTNVEDYIDNFTVITALSFEKLSYLFKIYFEFLVFILFIFMIQLLINRVKLFSKI